eukprot:4759286-Amphidinium_carterae.1
MHLRSKACIHDLCSSSNGLASNSHSTELDFRTPPTLPGKAAALTYRGMGGAGLYVHCSTRTPVWVASRTVG